MNKYINYLFLAFISMYYGFNLYRQTLVKKKTIGTQIGQKDVFKVEFDSKKLDKEKIDKNKLDLNILKNI
jgi:hypothetical protein